MANTTWHGARRVALTWLALGLQAGGAVAADAPDAGLAIYRRSLLEADTRIYEGEVHAWNGEPIEDADAVNGSAQWASPDRHAKGHAYVFCSGHESRPRPGRYRLTFRMKVLRKPPKAVPVCDLLAYNHSGQKGKLLFHKRTPLTTADFNAPGVYQEFELPLERYDVAFAAIAVQWKKKVEIVVDRVTLTPEHFFTDEELCRKENLRPAPSTRGTDTRPAMRLLVVAGPYHRHFRLAAALEHLPGASTDFCYANRSRNYGHGLKPDLPGPRRLAGYDVVLLLDVPGAPLHLSGRLALMEYVRAGGGLFAAGGPFAFGKGAYENTFIARVLPVGLDGPWGLLPAEKGRTLTFGTDPLLAGLFNKGKPMVPWYHRLEAKPGSQVLISIGTTPILVTGRFGRGRVAALGATPLGQPAAGGKHLLACDDWPVLLGRVLTWVAKAARQRGAATQPAADGSDPAS